MRNKINWLLSTMLLTAVLQSASAFKAKEQPMKVENGVSRQLAAERRKSVSNIKYELAFSIPEEKDVAVTGCASILFDYSGNSDLQIDFQCSKGDVPANIMINGKKTKTIFENEHFVIAKKYLRKKGNIVKIDGFTASDKNLNRRADFLYTLFVPDHARSVFPCFDQPDLKARFSLKLTMPKHWKAISNAPATSIGPVKKFEPKPKAAPTMLQVYEFEETDLLPTYLFSFVAGEFETRKEECNGREIEALYRKQDEKKEAQLSTVFEEIALSIDWLEQYTGIKYPFKKFGVVVLPGYQFGGMEHPGAIQLNERRIFLGNNPTIDEELSRLNLIAHETAHMWFGDLVTMEWFNDVWTKEVFANFMADKISRQRFPSINHELSFLRAHYPPALATDRTAGTHPIQQPLDNLNKAGLLYGNIIYHKAPIMMQKLETLMGEESLQEGLREYLKAHSYGNATWDDLIVHLDKANPEADVEQFSQVWVKEAGLPTISYKLEINADSESIKQDLVINETDESGNGLHWQQNFKWGIVTPDGLADVPMTVNEVDIDLSKKTTDTISDCNVRVSIPNLNGDGYGRFVLDDSDAESLLQLYTQLPDNQRMAALMTLYENFRMKRIEASKAFISFYGGLLMEENELIASQCISYLGTLLTYLDRSNRTKAEQLLKEGIDKISLPSACLQLKRLLSQSATCEDAVSYIYNMWESKSDTTLTERDYTNMSYHLMQVLPTKFEEIRERQLARIENQDLRREFNFVVQACQPDTTAQLRFFNELLKAENRQVEVWAASALTLLNKQINEPFSNRYLRPALDALEEIQRTGDIFFPADWLHALLSGHRSKEAKVIVDEWIETHPDLPTPLMNKLKEAEGGVLF